MSSALAGAKDRSAIRRRERSSINFATFIVPIRCKFSYKFRIKIHGCVRRFRLRSRFSNCWRVTMNSHRITVQCSIPVVIPRSGDRGARPRGRLLGYPFASSRTVAPSNEAHRHDLLDVDAQEGLSTCTTPRSARRSWSNACRLSHRSSRSNTRSGAARAGDGRSRCRDRHALCRAHVDSQHLRSASSRLSGASRMKASTAISRTTRRRATRSPSGPVCSSNRHRTPVVGGAANPDLQSEFCDRGAL